MRKHEDEALILLTHNLKKWHEDEFGEILNLDEIDMLLEKLKQERTLAFLKRRIAHLTDQDFIKFIDLLKTSGKKKAKT